jgi:hypothetical protein
VRTEIRFEETRAAMTTPPRFAHTKRASAPAPLTDEEALVFAAICDCKVAYWWNPYDGPEALTYEGWSTAMYAGVDAETRTAYIAFRGTDQTLDFLMDVFCLTWFQRRHRLVGHAGFLITWNLARKRLLPWLQEHRGRFDHVVVTGHSLGGALALACAHEVHASGYSLGRCITIGAPRVYLWPSALLVEGAIGARCIRVECTDDLVAKVPPAWLGYAHVGKPEPFSRDLLGESHLDDLRVMPMVDAALYIMTGGPLASLFDKLGGKAARGSVFWLVLGGLASLGVVAAAIVQATVATSLLGPLLLLVGAILIVGFGRAHRSASYMNHVRPSQLLARWEAHTSQTHADSATAVRHTWLTAAPLLRADVSSDQQDRFIKAFDMRFGDLDGLDVNLIDLGRPASDVAAMAFGQASARTESEEQHLAFRRAVLVLLRLGFTPDEVNGIVETGVIGRPAHWSRFYRARVMFRRVADASPN